MLIRRRGEDKMKRKRMAAALCSALLLANLLSAGAAAREDEPIKAGESFSQEARISAARVRPDVPESGVGDPDVPEESPSQETQAPPAQEKPAGFPDVPEKSWYTQAVTALSEQGVISGMPDGSFQPQSRVTRAQFVKLLAGISGKEITARADRNTFSDVPDKAWYADYVRWGIKEKFITGRSAESFDPNGLITRQEAAVILWRFNKNAMGKTFPRYQKTNFKDKNAISSWADVEVDAVEGAGLMKGYDDRTFRPKAYATRAETAVLLYRYQKAQEQYPKGVALDDLRYIMHGGGKVYGTSSTNSYEALEQSYESGCRIMEVDFSWTTDDRLVCLHDWGGEYPEKCSLEAFMNKKLLDFLTPMSLDTLADFMRARPDVMVIPDVKERNPEAIELISRSYPDLADQFIPYIFHVGEYEHMRDLGYRHIMLALYQMKQQERDYEALADFCRRENLVGIAVNPNTESAIYGPAKNAGIPVLPYVVDMPSLMLELSQQGADGFFANTPGNTIEW